MKKRVTNFFYTLQYFASPGGPPEPKVTGLGDGVHQPLSSYLQNFVPFRRSLSEISTCQTSSILFVTQKKKHKKTYSKRYVSALHAATVRKENISKRKRMQDTRAKRNQVVSETNTRTNSNSAEICNVSSAHYKPRHPHGV